MSSIDTIPKLTKPAYCDNEDLYNLILKLTSFDPKQRPLVSEIVAELQRVISNRSTSKRDGTIFTVSQDYMSDNSKGSKSISTNSISDPTQRRAKKEGSYIKRNDSYMKKSETYMKKQGSYMSNGSKNSIQQTPQQQQKQRSDRSLKSIYSYTASPRTMRKRDKELSEGKITDTSEEQSLPKPTNADGHYLNSPTTPPHTDSSDE